jgi:uncharacterized protein with FMN-binding domain
MNEKYLNAVNEMRQLFEQPLPTSSPGELRNQVETDTRDAQPEVVKNTPNEPENRTPITNADNINKENQVTANDKPKSDKEYFGSKGNDIHYYLVRVKSEGEEGKLADLQIITSNDELQFSAKENKLSVEDEAAFVKAASQKVDVDVISTQLVDSLDLLGFKKEEEDRVAKQKEAAGLTGEQPKNVKGNQPEGEQPSQQPEGQ